MTVDSARIPAAISSSCKSSRLKSAPANEASEPLREIWITPRTLEFSSITGADISFCIGNGWLVSMPSDSPSFTVSNMLACSHRAKLLKISDFLLIAVCAAIELLVMGIDPRVRSSSG